MDKIIMKRNFGKTYQLLKISDATQNVIVCHSIHECKRIAREASDLGFEIPTPITYDDITNGRLIGKQINGLLIDNIEMFLQSLTPIPITAITLNP